MSSPPTSPLRARASSRASQSPSIRRPAIPPGFRAIPKPKPRPIQDLSVRELHDLYQRNAKILAEPGASTSTYVHRVSAEQAAIEAQLVEVDGMETIDTGLKRTRIKGEDDMNVDQPPEPPVSRAIEAKRRALSRFGGSSTITSLSMQEAIEIEQRAHAQDLERRQRLEEKKRRMGASVKGETRQEREARIWAFMNYKPSESDLEDDDDEDSDDDDPATWFEDDQDDGRKGQDLVEPDEEDLSNVIRIDENQLHYSTFYEPREEGD